MAFIPMKTRTEMIVEEKAGYMEFDLVSEAGYGQWLGMFHELGQAGRMFNGYMVQNSVLNAQMSNSPVEMHLFQQGMFVAPPQENEQYYFELQRELVHVGRVYFKIPDYLEKSDLEGYKPSLLDLLALDIWSETLEPPGQVIYTFFYEAEIETETRHYHIERVRLNDQERLV